MVDHADGQPQDPALDLLEELERLAERALLGPHVGVGDHGATIAGANLRT
jgi:hypothetical protein